MSANIFSPDNCHKILYGEKPLLSFENGKDSPSYRQELKAKFTELLGDMPVKVEPETEIEFVRERETYKEIRFRFYSEAKTLVPCHLFIPKGKEKPPVVICLQGHSRGMHLSYGKAHSLKEKIKVKFGDRDFALQAVSNGYAALILEQRCFGERLSDYVNDYSKRCHTHAMNALLLGRTLIGERVWDVSRAIDVLETFKEIDSAKVACMGNSGGGTVTYYAACMDERIQIAMPSCSISNYRDSIGSTYHCVCNYIPKARRFFDMSDLATLIAPRPLVIVAGEKDAIFPVKAMRETYQNIKAIYTALGSEGNCSYFEGPRGHRFYRDAWQPFNAYAKQCGWDMGLQ